jgi:hypothetical protein
VSYIRLIAEDTIDEIIATALERKRNMASTLLSDIEGGINLSGLTAAEMCTLIADNKLPKLDG